MILTRERKLRAGEHQDSDSFDSSHVGSRSKFFQRIRLRVILCIMSLFAVVCFSVIFALASGYQRQIQAAKPAIQVDFADPAIIRFGKSWLSFASGANGVNVQAAESTDDGKTWRAKLGLDILPNLPGWVHKADSRVWAPSLVMIVSV
jgi:hypothetical protein